MSLARLRSLESVELMSAAIEHLVKVSERGRFPPPKWKGAIVLVYNREK